MSDKMKYDLKNKKDRKQLFATVLTLLKENHLGIVEIEFNGPEKEEWLY